LGLERYFIFTLTWKSSFVGNEAMYVLWIFKIHDRCKNLDGICSGVDLEKK
jgi:hypothetical protein